MNKEQEEQLLLKLIIKALEKLDVRMEGMDSRLDNIDVTMAANTESLVDHIRRTTNLEERLENDIEPAVKFYNGLIFVGKGIGIIALLVSIVGGVFEAVKFIGKL